MPHYCKCVKCGEKFNRDKIPAVKISSARYGHASCYPEITEILPIVEDKKEVLDNKNNEDYNELKNYIDKLFNRKTNWPLVGKQLKTYKEEYGFSYSGMLKSLIYAYEVKKNDILKAKGVGCIPICYQDAYNYYYSIWLANQQNADKIILKNYKINEEILKIPPPTPIKQKSKYFSFLDEEEI